jgi:hypothetical protein
MGSEVVKKIILGLSLLGILFADDIATISSTLCSVVRFIRTAAVILAIVMFTVGGILYAIGNVLTGGMKQSAHGWAQGLIIGGVIALVLVIIAEPLVNTFAKIAGAYAPGMTELHC